MLVVVLLWWVEGWIELLQLGSLHEAVIGMMERMHQFLRGPVAQERRLHQSKSSWWL